MSDWWRLGEGWGWAVLYAALLGGYLGTDRRYLLALAALGGAGMSWWSGRVTYLEERDRRDRSR